MKKRMDLLLLLFSYNIVCKNVADNYSIIVDTRDVFLRLITGESSGLKRNPIHVVGGRPDFIK